MLKRKAEYDARHKKKTKTDGSTSSGSASTAAAASLSSTPASSSSTLSTKKSHLSSEEKAQHRDVSLYLNKQRTLVLSSRGIGYRDRHLLQDLLDLLPHGKKDNKLDTKHGLDVLNELAMLKQCNNVLYLESRKRSDLYLWLSRAGVGPSVKCLLQAVHTMSEVKLTGNCLKYSRPLLVWDAAFDSAPHWRLLKSLLHQSLASPKGHPKVKPFVDHALAFFILDARVWIRHYQIVDSEAATASSSSSSSSPQLVEIGPRLVLHPIRMFSGSFGGATLWENAEFVSPNALRAQMKAARGSEYVKRQAGKQSTRAHKRDAQLPDNEIDSVFAADAGAETEAASSSS
jgi:ribosome biogenesis protein BRX1